MPNVRSGGIKFVGLGILDLEKFAAALHLRWLWLEWTDDSKSWIGLGNPCTDDDRDLFVAATTVVAGESKRTYLEVGDPKLVV